VTQLGGLPFGSPAGYCYKYYSILVKLTPPAPTIVRAGFGKEERDES